MTSVHTARSEAGAGLAIGGGVLAGILTLAVVTGLLWLAGGGDDGLEAGGGAGGTGRVGSLVAAADLSVGDCMNFTSPNGGSARFVIADCEAAHVAQISAKVQHPDASGPYPGADDLKGWVAGRCRDVSETFINASMLETTLAVGSLVPDFEEWSAGNYDATCYVRQFDSSSLTSSVAGRGADFPRGEEVIVSRLIEGDCFVPAGGTNSYDLNSNSTVRLVSCDGEHNGVFFGRDRLDYPIGALFPGEDEVGDATSQRCGQLFTTHFGASSEGFNYRYWRPNQQSWDVDDRAILCAVLDSDPLTERLDPSTYDRFFDLETGQCFNLGPEETPDSLRLDDQVRVVPCDESHVGQMIGSGDLDLDLAEPFPADDGVQDLAGKECEQLFVDFVGTSPYESAFGNFPFWYPNQSGWEEGDRRYACAFLDSEPRTDTLEDADA